METAVEKLTALFFLVTGLSHIFAPRAWVRFFIMLREKQEVGSLMNALVHFPWAPSSSPSTTSGTGS